MVLAITGPTGVGKSDVALAAARLLDGEIVNYDSIQMVRGFDIGSAKPNRAMLKEVPHHLIDVVDPIDPLDAAVFVNLARGAVRDILGRGKVPILVGGTFFYLRGLLDGIATMPGQNRDFRRRIARIRSHQRGRWWLTRWLRRVDPLSADRIAVGDTHRVERALEVWFSSGRPISSYVPDTPGLAMETATVRVALRRPREDLQAMIDSRAAAMFEAGLVEETETLLSQWPDSARPFDAIGYREAVGVVRRRLSRVEAIDETRRRTRAYAKRQMTWLRGERDMQWIDVADDPEALASRVQRIVEARAERNRPVQ